MMIQDMKFIIYLQIAFRLLSKSEGPAIKILKSDHEKTASYKSLKEAVEYRNLQKKLIENGNFIAALSLDIVDIREKFGSKYDDAIVEVKEYVANLMKRGML